jgi:hypothetical protein
MPECRYVEDCDGFDCYQTQRACDCACGDLDPESPECRCENADECVSPRVLDEECGCDCPSPCEPPRVPDENCDCACPENACSFPKTPDENCDCVCPDTSPCGGGKFRSQSNCNCYCPQGKIDVDGVCVDAETYNCVEGGCEGVSGPSGAYATLEECADACNYPPCFPIPTAPVGEAIFCEDGTQRGVISYIFSPATCSWVPIEIIFLTCPGDESDSSGDSSGGSPSSDGCECDGAVAEAIQREDDFICGFPVPKRVGAGFSDATAGCVASYTTYEWCEECGDGGFPVLKRADTYSFDNASCEFDTISTHVFACPGQSSDSGSSSSAGSESSSSSSSESSSEPSSSSAVFATIPHNPLP